MDKARLSNAEKLKICQRYYHIGFFALPVMWMINYLWFRDEVKAPAFEEQEEIRRIRNRCGFGALLWILVLSVWIIVYQTNRVRWGAFGDNISFIIPTGSP